MSVDICVDEEIDFSPHQMEMDATRVLAHFAKGNAELSIRICTDDAIWPLNRDYRGKDKPTDVLAFAQLEGNVWPGSEQVLGDVVISLDTARRQAEERGHSTDYELRVLLVHGVCHLLGYDHERDDDAELMEAKERQILAELAAFSRS